MRTKELHAFNIRSLERLGEIADRRQLSAVEWFRTFGAISAWQAARASLDCLEREGITMATARDYVERLLAELDQ